MSPPINVFKNWIEAASNAKNLLDRGEIDYDEYGKILARAKKEQGELGQAPPHSRQIPRRLSPRRLWMIQGTVGLSPVHCRLGSKFNAT
jgi:hypothetical protein